MYFKELAQTFVGTVKSKNYRELFFCILVIVNKAEMNMGVQILFLNTNFNSFGHT